MTDPDLIIRIAAKGDGVTADGRHVALSAPGDRIAADGSLIHGPDRATPPCRHFPTCGGCQLQHLSDEAYGRYVRDRVAGALAGQGIAADEVVDDAHVSPPESRRRASLKAVRIGRRIVLGFSEAGSHRVVDMRECPLLHPALFALVEPLRLLLSGPGLVDKAANVVLALTDQGPDVLLEHVRAEGLAAAEALTAFAKGAGLARLTLVNDAESMTVWEPDRVTVSFAGHAVGYPQGAFLQATAEGEAALVAEVARAVGDAPLVADLFAGLGTFALSVADGRKVYAAEASRDLVLALKSAGDRLPGRLFTEHRDLFRRPLIPAELDRFAAVILDPPRAGAREQVAQIAASAVPTVSYVSCNPSSFARDAVTLVAGGYRLDRVKPVGQFRWSTHVELAALFTRR